LYTVLGAKQSLNLVGCIPVALGYRPAQAIGGFFLGASHYEEKISLGYRLAQLKVVSNENEGGW